MFREICNLVSALTGFTIGVDLITGHDTQQSPDRRILIQESAGGEGNEESPDMAMVHIQFLSRAKKYFDARTDIWTVYKALEGLPGSGWNMARVDGSGADYLLMSTGALALPQYIGEDENRRHEFTLNMVFRIEEGSCGGGLSP